jgi:hypothetical protein
VAAAIGGNNMEEVTFVYNNDGALGGIAKKGFDNDPSKKNTASLPQAQYYTVSFSDVLYKMNAPATMDYLSLDVEGTTAVDERGGYLCRMLF